MTIKVDRRVYSDGCITDTLYWLGQKYTCSRSVTSDSEETISIESMNIGQPDIFIENPQFRKKV